MTAALVVGALFGLLGGLLGSWLQGAHTGTAYAQPPEEPAK